MYVYMYANLKNTSTVWKYRATGKAWVQTVQSSLMKRAILRTKMSPFQSVYYRLNAAFSYSHTVILILYIVTQQQLHLFLTISIITAIPSCINRMSGPKNHDMSCGFFACWFEPVWYTGIMFSSFSLKS